ncbi:BlaI/MecI/CopY family transcriptional regulator [Salegentibacter sp. JZCK2]|uniref:BlaI/MecI/CopY family transcriptional regulator n=1 Tax=Salegentibacter tibetensis TaxID=2873600 RepID=UPI001CCA1B54|nr:BlaI/MecI/CopY family transcriptional regulator [Salegentibacter tibetensis]MBZ9728791.1 BlaI/MecI/CopY family transcriptional regulator [Salegentibacter tibetensis]
MKRLTNKEEEVMRILWQLEKAFVKEIIPHIQDKKLHYNTVSTIVRHLEDKGFVAHDAYGNTHQYYPVISKEKYRKHIMSLTSKRFFDNSYKSMVSFFAKEEKISADELREILEIIEKEKKD